MSEQILIVGRTNTGKSMWRKCLIRLWGSYHACLESKVLFHSNKHFSQGWDNICVYLFTPYHPSCMIWILSIRRTQDGLVHIGRKRNASNEEMGACVCGVVGVCAHRHHATLAEHQIWVQDLVLVFTTSAIDCNAVHNRTPLFKKSIQWNKCIHSNGSWSISPFPSRWSVDCS